MAAGAVNVPTRLDRFRLALIALFVLLAGVYAFVLPPFEAPDEASHFYVAATIARTHQLPEPPAGSDENAQRLHEAFQPPLYYIALAAWLSPFDLSNLEAFVDRQNPDWYDVPGVAALYRHANDDAPAFAGPLAALRAARLFSVALGALTVWAVVAIAAALAAAAGINDPWLPRVAGALVAFAPKFLNMSASVSNDIALTAVATLAMWAMLRGGPTPRRGLLVGALIALAAMSKVSGIALLAPALAWLLSGPRRTWLPAGLAVLAAFAVVGGPWLLRNQTLYGDPLGWLRAEAANAVTLRAAPLGAAELLAAVPGWLRSLWGDLAIRQALPAWMDVFFWALLLLGLLGLIRAGVARKLPAGPVLPVLLAWMLALLMGYLSWTRTHHATENGRLLMPAVGAFAGLLALGLRAAIPARHAAVGARAVCVGVLSMGALAPALVVSPAYAPPPLFASADAPVAVFNQEVGLLRVEVDGVRVAAGGSLPVRVVWGATRPITRSLRAIVELVDAAGEVVGRVEAIPNRGRYSTDRWAVGNFFVDAYDVPVLPGAARAVAELRVGLRDAYGQPEILPLQNGQNRYAAARIKVSGPAPALPTWVGMPIEARFAGDAVALRAVDLSVSGPAAAPTLRIAVRHEALGAPPERGVLFVQALDAAGRVVGQSDREPLDGAYPTRFWEKGETLVETRAFTVTAPVARVVAGWYDAQSGVRWAAKRADGTAWTDNIVILWEAAP
ncbi:MAG: glycosyltransferase family 39 protein [Thermoflexales bacterium]|nr:glycosyltransferase family 39 protein [Thermoflexales bacterium]